MTEHVDGQEQSPAVLGDDATRGRAWLMAVRPQTLPAGAAPVIVGTAVAIHEGVFAAGPASAALVGALLIQIGTNFANDYYDAMRGVDDPDRAGFTRVTSAGLLPPATVKQAMAGTFLAAIVLGTYLVYVGGIPIVIVGLVSVACGIAYAGGPIPFGSYGLGDLFVFVFFGLVATVGTYYVQAVTIMAGAFPIWVPGGTISGLAVIAGVAMGCLTTAILVVNNLRDLESDRQAGKFTLAVLIGPRLTIVEHAVLLVVAYVIPVWLIATVGSWWLGLPLFTAPYAVVLGRRVSRNPPPAELNAVLEATGKLLVAYAVAFAVGMVMA